MAQDNGRRWLKFDYFVLPLLLILAFYIAFIPHSGYGYPVHLDEWLRMAGAKQIASNATAVGLMNPISGEPFTDGRDYEVGYHLFWAVFHQVSGLQEARGDIIVTLDADGATDPEELQRFIEPLLNGFDFAKGSRLTRGLQRNKPWHRLLGNWLITLTFNILFFRRYSDLCSGYNAFWRERVGAALEPWPDDGFENEPFINSRIARRRLKVIEVGHSEPGRLSGEVKEKSWRQGTKAIKSIIRERFRGR